MKELSESMYMNVSSKFLILIFSKTSNSFHYLIFKSEKESWRLNNKGECRNNLDSFSDQGSRLWLNIEEETRLGY